VTRPSAASFNDLLGGVIAKAGGTTALAGALGRTRQCVYHWRKLGYVPFSVALRIEKLYGVPHRLLISDSIRTLFDETAHAAVV